LTDQVYITYNRQLFHVCTRVVETVRNINICIYIILLIFIDRQSEVSLQLIALTSAMSLGGCVWSQSHRTYVSFKYIATHGSEWCTVSQVPVIACYNKHNCTSCRIKRGGICQRMALDPMTEAPRSRFLVPIFPKSESRGTKGMRGRGPSET